MNTLEFKEILEKTWEKVEIDKKFELEKLEKPKIPEYIKKWANNFLEKKGM